MIGIVPSPLGWALKTPGGVEIEFLARERGWTQEMIGEIEDLLEMVHSDGFEEGKKEGADEGYATGRKDGHDEGYDEGYEDAELKAAKDESD